ncbi:MAG: hypothetical protein B7Z55_19405, partial [Planctomycetales bacterium 12-60-4]
NFGLRVADWKLVRQRSGPKGAKKPSFSESLFDLSNDAGEEINISSQHPRELTRLHALLEKLITDGRSRSTRPTRGSVP